MRSIGKDEEVRQHDGKNYNSALVRNLLLREPLRTDPRTPIARSDPPTVPVPTTSIPSTSLGIRSPPVSSAMDAVMATGPNAKDPLPTGVTLRQIDERRPPLAGPNCAKYDPRWHNLVSHSVRRPEAVVCDH